MVRCRYRGDDGVAVAMVLHGVVVRVLMVMSLGQWCYHDDGIVTVVMVVSPWR